MSAELQRWATIERQFLKDEIEQLENGGTLTSASGDDISKEKLSELKARVEHVNQVLGKLNS